MFERLQDGDQDGDLSGKLSAMLILFC